jgi:nicotinate phosphoribosyltransferase
MGVWVNDDNAALLTDLYELTMAASYVANGMDETATFDLFVRELPPRRSFLIACGLEQALDYLERLRFDSEAVAYLRSLGMFPEEFLDRLGELRFTGEVWAVPEGEPVFPGEPLLRVTAPLPEAQIVETFLLTTISFETMIASKAARVSLACDDRGFVDFSPRRDHGPDAALKVARAAYVGGADGTSNTLAGKAYGMPVRGTMAHSYVMRFDDEAEAFRTFARDFPDNATLLIDTYDTEEGARRAVAVAKELAGEGVRLRGVRLDSGDLGALAKSVRAILDEGGQEHVLVFASGDLDEYQIAELLRAGAPIDAFGVGTQLGTSGDAPSLGAVYKLVEHEGKPTIKLSAAKATLPGRKQVWRVTDEDGVYRHDVLALHDEELDGDRPVLKQVMEGGRRTAGPEPLEDIRERCRTGVAALPPALRTIEGTPPPYEVHVSDRLRALVDELTARHRPG